MFPPDLAIEVGKNEVEMKLGRIVGDYTTNLPEKSTCPPGERSTL